MKKIKYFLFSIFVGLIFINSVSASELRLSSISNEVVSGNVVNIKLELIIDEVNVNIDHCKVRIYNDTSIEFKEVQALNSWTMNNKNINENEVEISVKNYQNSLYGHVNIASLKYLVNESGNFRINSAVCYDKSNNQLSSVGYDAAELMVNAIIPKETELSSLKINNEELNPYFSPNVRSYSINDFTSNSLSLSYELADLSYEDKVEVLVNDRVITDLENIPYELSGDNQFMLITINITDNSSYNIFVSKENSNLDTQYLQSITINGSVLELIPNKFDYEYTVSDDVSVVEVLAELYDSEKFEFSSLSNAPASFKMPGKVAAIFNVVPKDNQSGIPAVTYTVTITNESYVSGVSNPDTSDTSMYVVLTILIISLIGSTIMYRKNLNNYK